MSPFRIATAGDSALVAEWESPGGAVEDNSDDDIDVSRRMVALAAAMEAAPVPGVLDIVPTFRTVAVYFDPLRTDFDALSLQLEQRAAQADGGQSASQSLYRVPLCYGGAFGPDLPEVAADAGLSEDAVIALHSAPTYRVFMLGFVPGFAYLGPVDARIAARRRTTPRVRVAAGSVGIAGMHTGIYPSETPGGWQVVGRTPVRPYDPGRSEPFLFKAGDRVQFYPVPPSAYAEGYECLPSA